MLILYEAVALSIAHKYFLPSPHKEIWNEKKKQNGELTWNSAFHTYYLQAQKYVGLKFVFIWKETLC